MADIESTIFHALSHGEKTLSNQVDNLAGQQGIFAEAIRLSSSDLDIKVEPALLSGSTIPMDLDPSSQPDSSMDQLNHLPQPTDPQPVVIDAATQPEALVGQLTSSDSMNQDTNDGPQAPCDMVMAAGETEAEGVVGQITSSDSLNQETNDGSQAPGDMIVPTGEIEATDAVDIPARTDSLSSSLSAEHSAVATPQPRSRKRKVVETSAKPPRKRYRAKGPTKLRKGKQVISEVPMDVWSIIFSYCPAKFLAKARRISKAFNYALQYESVWRRNRLQNYGPDLPEPFPGMREDEYANLLEGLGCMDCGTPKTRKTYWVWRKRWCIGCYEKNTIKHEAAAGLVGDHRQLLMDCVPYGVVDSWGHYEAAGFYEHAVSRSGHGHYRVFGKADIKRLYEELEERMKPDADGNTPSAVDIQQWYADKKVIRDQTMGQNQKVELWIETRARQKLFKNAEIKKDRDKFFRERVGQLNPPLDPEALQFIKLYKKAIDIAKPPSERAWRMLIPKLESDRAQAEAQLEERRIRALKAERAAKERTEYLDKLKMRADGCPQQRMLQLLADEVLEEFDEPAEPIADADFALLALREIRRKYYERWENCPARGSRPIPYRLVLEDARYVLDTKIFPVIDSWGPLRSVPAKLFKCPGCTRTDTNLRYPFQPLICHIRAKHATHVGDFHYLYREGLQDITNVHWLNIEWPINLPVLANHHAATGKWDPHDETPYVRYQSPWDRQTVSAYNGRQVSEEGPELVNVVNNIIYAGSMLRDTPLDGTFKTNIVVKFAVEKCRASFENPSFSSPVEDIIDLPLDLIRYGLYDIFDRFRCAVCLLQGGCTARETNKIHSVGTLIQHFQLRHAGMKDWATDMMQLPDDRELWRVLNQPDMQSALNVFDRLFPRCERTLQTDGDDMSHGITSEQRSPSEADTSQAALHEVAPSTSIQNMPQPQPMGATGTPPVTNPNRGASGPPSQEIDGLFNELLDASR